jgi:hypothetical protein
VFCCHAYKFEPGITVFICERLTRHYFVDIGFGM